MIKFIKLTESMTHGDTKPLLLNASYIAHIQGGLSGKDTHIRLSDFKTFYFVKESAAEIWEKLK